MSDVDHASAQTEHKFHYYTGNRIPWWVRVPWLLFWIFVAYYTLVYLIPNLQQELLSPP